jgi:hypothetical protein
MNPNDALRATRSDGGLPFKIARATSAAPFTTTSIPVIPENPASLPEIAPSAFSRNPSRKCRDLTLFPRKSLQICFLCSETPPAVHSCSNHALPFAVAGALTNRCILSETDSRNSRNYPNPRVARPGSVSRNPSRKCRDLLTGPPKSLHIRFGKSRNSSGVARPAMLSTTATRIQPHLQPPLALQSRARVLSTPSPFFPTVHAHCFATHQILRRPHAV